MSAKMKVTKPAKVHAKPVKTAPSGAGVKFTEKYGVKLTSNYDIDPDSDVLIVPPKGHALYDPDGNTTFDEIRVKEIDAVGKCVRVITVWSDPDAGKLYIIAGRGNYFDVREVNRQRRERGDEPMMISFLRFPGNLDQAVDFVAMENFRRKRPSAIHLAREIIRYKNLGRPWSRIATLLQLDDEDEKALRARIPIAYCIPEVVEAITLKKMSIKKAKKFGGRDIDGKGALGRDEQLALLGETLDAKTTKKTAAPAGTETTKTKGRPPRDRLIRTGIAEHLANGTANKLPPPELTIARAIAAYERAMSGDITALDYLPGIKKIIEEARGKLADASPTPST